MADLVAATRVARAGIIFVVLIAPLFLASPTEADVFFRATAIADGLNTIASGAAVPFGAVAEGGSPAAQSVVDSLGNSRGYAADPYPGDFVVSVPGTVNGILPVPASVPGYPAFVTSDAETQPEAHADYGAYTLSSKSDASGTTATGAEGDKDSGEGYAAVDAQTHTADGNVRVSAASTVTSFIIPGVLSFGSVVTQATVTHDQSSRLQTHSDIQVWGASVAGQPVGFSDGHFVAPGTDQPLPADPLAATLRKAGVTLQYVAAQRLPNGIASPAIQVTVTQNAPAGNPTSGKYTVTHVLGRSIATLDLNGRAAGAPAAKSGAGTPSMGGRSTNNTPVSGGSVQSTGSSVAPMTPPTTGEQGSTPTVAPSQPSADAPVRDAAVAASPGHVETVDIYLAIVVAACFLFGSSQLVRHLGSKYGWR
jgi:hypothetical protein